MTRPPVPAALRRREPGCGLHQGQGQPRSAEPPPGRRRQPSRGRTR